VVKAEQKHSERSRNSSMLTWNLSLGFCRANRPVEGCRWKNVQLVSPCWKWYCFN